MVGTPAARIPRCDQRANSVNEHLVIGVRGVHQGIAVLDEDGKVLCLKALDRCGAGGFDNLPNRLTGARDIRSRDAHL